MMSAFRVGRYSEAMDAASWKTTTASSSRRCGLRYSTSSFQSIRSPLSRCVTRRLVRVIWRPVYVRMLGVNGVPLRANSVFRSGARQAAETALRHPSPRKYGSGSAARTGPRPEIHVADPAEHPVALEPVRVRGAGRVRGLQVRRPLLPGRRSVEDE